MNSKLELKNFQTTSVACAGLTALSEQEISGKRSSARAIWLLLMLAICSTGTLLFLTVFEPHRAQQAVSEASQKKCTNPSIRKEWRQLRDHEKLSYIDAVLCLTKTPSTAGTGGSMYDDLAGVHMEYAPRGETSRSIDTALHKLTFTIKCTMQHPSSPGIASSSTGTSRRYDQIADIEGHSRKSKPHFSLSIGY